MFSRIMVVDKVMSKNMVSWRGEWGWGGEMGDPFLTPNKSRGHRRAGRGGGTEKNFRGFGTYVFQE